MRSANLIFKLALVWITNSSIKLQPLIGEQGTNYGAASFATNTDRQTGLPLLNQTFSRYQVGGTDLGCSFEHDGRVNFLFGDTMAWRTSTNPLTGLILNFFTNSCGPNVALTIVPANVDMGPFNVPAAGGSNNGNFYIVCKTGHTTATGNTNDYSLLVRFDETNQTFAPGRTISSLTNGGHFIDGPRSFGHESPHVQTGKLSRQRRLSGDRSGGKLGERGGHVHKLSVIRFTNG